MLRLAGIPALLAMLAGLLSPGIADAQPAPKKVKIAMGPRVITVAYPWLTMPQALGYWKADGLDVDVIPVGGSIEAI
jgi:NitT/TauT family transport system substrate-binding protein